MAKKKQKEITLVSTGKIKRERKFPLSVAIEILNMKYPGYELAEKNYIYQDGNIIESTSSGANPESKEQQIDKKV